MHAKTLRVIVVVTALGFVAAACGDDAADTAPATTVSTVAPTVTEAPMATAAPSPAAADIVDTAVAAGDFTTLVTAVKAAGLEQTLRGDGPFTVFAPTDDAFAALPAGTIETLLKDPTGDLSGILTYHVVAGAVTAADVVGLDGSNVTTVNGATFTVAVTDDGSVTLTDTAGNHVAVVATDVPATNGVIHVIDAVLLPS